LDLPSYYESLYSPILTSLFEDPIEQVMRESMDMQPNSLEKSDTVIEIPSFQYKNAEENFKINNTSCSICITDFEDESLVSITKCNHAFHNECIVEWGKYKTACPICREKL
jgi:hypothetical protein